MLSLSLCLAEKDTISESPLSGAARFPLYAIFHYARIARTNTTRANTPAQSRGGVRAERA